MTAQINDIVFYRGLEYDLAGINGNGLFDPAEHGMRPVMISTGCYRGYFCAYEVVDGVLRLQDLHIRLPEDGPDASKEDQRTILFNVHPSYDPDQHCWLYSDLSWIMPFTGGLLLGDGFVRELYTHMGFHPAWKYRRVHELIFESGRLAREMDRSEEMDRIRGEVANTRSLESSDSKQGRGGPATQDEILEWIEACFNRGYGGQKRAPEFAPTASNVPSRPPTLLPAEIRDFDSALACPHCKTPSTRYRRLGSGKLVCLNCGRSLSWPD
jgi:hypothetical protein